MTLAAGDVTLVRADRDHRPAVERLQHAAYARNRELLGLEPLPLLADYEAILRDHEVWIRPGDQPGTIDAALILETDRPVVDGCSDVLIWSVATAPTVQQTGLGRALLQCADVRARQLGRDNIRLYRPTSHPPDRLVRAQRL